MPRGSMPTASCPSTAATTAYGHSASFSHTGGLITTLPPPLSVGQHDILLPKNPCLDPYPPIQSP